MEVTVSGKETLFRRVHRLKALAAIPTTFG